MISVDHVSLRASKASRRKLTRNLSSQHKHICSAHLRIGLLP